LHLYISSVVALFGTEYTDERTYRLESPSVSQTVGTLMHSLHAPPSEKRSEVDFLDLLPKSSKDQ